MFAYPLFRASAFTYSCAGAGCSIDASGCSANPYTGQSGCACSYSGNEVVCTQPTGNESASRTTNYLESGATLPSDSSSRLPNPLGVNSICGLIEAILRAAIAIGVPIAVLFIVFAGFKFILAQGNSTDLDKARRNLAYTLLGIGIFLGAWLFAEVIASVVKVSQVDSNNSSISSCT
jgi:hypothetical protein